MTSAAFPIPSVPIAQLSPGVNSEATSVTGVVTLLWPYSSLTQSLSLLLVEPDFRLRSHRGQVRIHFNGASAKAVARAGVGSGDQLLVSLNGVCWAQDATATSTPGKGIGWELQFKERALIEIQRASQSPILIDIDHPPASPQDPIHTSTPYRSPSLNSHMSTTTLPRLLSEATAWASPAFLKRRTLNFSPYDPFLEEEFPDNDRKKRIKFGRASGEWVFAERSPSRQAEDGDTANFDVSSPSREQGSGKGSGNGHAEVVEELPEKVEKTKSLGKRGNDEPYVHEAAAVEKDQGPTIGPSTPPITTLEPLDAEPLNEATNTKALVSPSASVVSIASSLPLAESQNDLKFQNDDYLEVGRDEGAFSRPASSIGPYGSVFSSVGSFSKITEDRAATEDGMEVIEQSEPQIETINDSTERFDGHHILSQDNQDAAPSSCEDVIKEPGDYDSTEGSEDAENVEGASGSEDLESYREGSTFEEVASHEESESTDDIISLEDAESIQDVESGQNVENIEEVQSSQDGEKPIVIEAKSLVLQQLDDEASGASEMENTAELDSDNGEEELQQLSSIPVLPDHESFSQGFQTKPATEENVKDVGRVAPMIHSDSGALSATSEIPDQSGSIQVSLKDPTVESQTLAAEDATSTSDPVHHTIEGIEKPVYDHLKTEESLLTHPGHTSNSTEISLPKANSPKTQNVDLENENEEEFVQPQSQDFTPQSIEVQKSPEPKSTLLDSSPEIPSMTQDETQKALQNPIVPRPSPLVHREGEESAVDPKPISQDDVHFVKTDGLNLHSDGESFETQSNTQVAEIRNESAAMMELPSTIQDTFEYQLSRSPPLTPNATHENRFISETSADRAQSPAGEDTLPTPGVTQATTAGLELPETPVFEHETLPVQKHSPNADSPTFSHRDTTPELMIVEKTAAPLPKHLQTEQDLLPSETTNINNMTPDLSLSSEQVTPAKKLTLFEKMKDLHRPSHQTPLRRSSNLSAISPWFAPKENGQVTVESDVDSESESLSEREGLYQKAQRELRISDKPLAKSFIRSPSQRKAASTVSLPGPPPPSQPESPGLRTKFSYFVFLATLPQYYSTVVDVLAITLSATPVTRATSGPKDFNQTIHVTDHSSTTQTPPVTTVQIFRPYKNCFPSLQIGDALLLRDFKVQSFEKRLALLSTESSAWTVFRKDEPVQIHGPPVDYGAEELAFAHGLRRWWANLSQDTKQNLILANSKQMGKPDKGDVAGQTKPDTTGQPKTKKLEVVAEVKIPINKKNIEGLGVDLPGSRSEKREASLRERSIGLDDVNESIEPSKRVLRPRGSRGLRKNSESPTKAIDRRSGTVFTGGLGEPESD